VTGEEMSPSGGEREPFPTACRAHPSQHVALIHYYFAEKFSNLLWVIGRDRTDKLFYTSGDPVARKNHPAQNRSQRPLPPGLGLEYAYPLNSDFVIAMLDRWMFRGFKDLERKTMDFAAEDVERYNATQVMRGTQYVFCKKRDFGLAERLCRKHSEICDPDRARDAIGGVRPVPEAVPRAGW
jgi:hypothetical protein